MIEYIIYTILAFLLLPLAVDILWRVFGWYAEWANALCELFPFKKRREQEKQKEVQKQPLRDAADKLVNLFKKKEEVAAPRPPPEPPEAEVAPKVGEYWKDRTGKVWGPLVENRDIFYNRPQDNPRSLLFGDMTWRNNGRYACYGVRSIFDLREKVPAPVSESVDRGEAPADRGDAPADRGDAPADRGDAPAEPEGRS